MSTIDTRQHETVTTFVAMLFHLIFLQGLSTCVTIKVNHIETYISQLIQHELIHK